ncbi:MAG: M56 family metallopeptidase [Ginsengibacter sp.]
MNLTALQHSAFLQSLGWAITNSLWQGAILWSIYLLVNSIHKNASSTFKTNISTASLFLLFAWFFVTFFQKLVSNLAEPLLVASPDPVTIHATSSSFISWHKIIEQILNTLPYLSVAYLFLLVLLVLRLFNSYKHIYFIKQNGLHKAGVEWRLFADRVAAHIGITRKITIWLSDHVDIPATIGFIKPVILIPVASINQLSVAQLEAIILHELSHIRRNDYLVNLFISLIETILFFNPFVMLLCKIIKKERENSCDDFVIQYQYDRHSYASALLSLEQSRMQHLRLALTATSGKKQLLHRIQRIMEVNHRNSGFNYGQKLLALILVTGIIYSVAWLSPEKTENKPAHITNATHLPTTVINARQPKHEAVAAASGTATQNSISSPVKARKITAVTINTDDLNAETQADENSNSEDDPPMVTVDENQRVGPGPDMNATQFFYNTDKHQQQFAAVQQNLKKNKQINSLQSFNPVQPFRKSLQVDFEKLKSYINGQEVSSNWKSVEDAINQNLQNIQLLTENKEEQNNILGEIKSIALNEMAKVSDSKASREKTRKLETFRQDLVRQLNRKFSEMADTNLTKAVAVVNNLSRSYYYKASQVASIYTPPVPVAPVKKRSAKQHLDQFEFHYNLDNIAPCKLKKNQRDECPKKFTIDYSKGTVLLNGQKINIAELNGLPESNLKKLAINADKQHLEIIVNN